MSRRPKYLFNSFYFQKLLFEKYLSDRFEFIFTPPFYKSRLPAFIYVPLNLLYLQGLYLTGKVKQYEIVHFNRSEAFFTFRKIPGQIAIFEIHGFDIGLLGESYLKDIHNPIKKLLGPIIDKLIGRRVKQKLLHADLVYCSTPDLVEPFEKWLGRKITWLPNPIDTGTFQPEGEARKLVGDPACFLASRLHGDKKPEVAIEIFQKYIKSKFPGATLHLLETGELVKKYKYQLADKQTYIWHKYMDKLELAATIRGADLCFGDFSIGALSMLPLQIMLCKKPIVTLDKFEILKSVEDLPGLALKLLEDQAFKDRFVERNYRYVLDHHSPARVCDMHLQNLQQLGYNGIEFK